MSADNITAFLREHGLDPEDIDPAAQAERMAEDMRAGLRGDRSSMPMIPTYLSNDGVVPKGVPAVVIDAGGTNFRRALVSFSDAGYEVSELKKSQMPGVGVPCSWQDFIRFVADSVEPLMDRADCIGFCFSYQAEITRSMDGRVCRIDKEVVIDGCEGQLIGASLIAELERRGIRGKRVVILNDTVAVLLGGAATLDKSGYGGFIGQVSGTGTNTCVSLPCSRIGKLGVDSPRGMLINLESGLYDGITGGDLDRLLDRSSHNPGSKIFEKQTSGAYLGELCRLALRAAADGGLMSPGSAEKIHKLQKPDGSNVDAWACGRDLGAVAAGPEDESAVQAISLAVLRRSARLMCVNLLALGLLIGQGRDASRPICVCAEGSLVQKCEPYREYLSAMLRDKGERELGIYMQLRIGQETTLPGSCAAALLNRA